MTVSEAREQFNQLLIKVFKQSDRVLIEKNRIPVAAVIAARDLEHLQRLKSERKRDFSILVEIGEAFKDVPYEELERQVALALADVREENRRQREAKSS